MMAEVTTLQAEEQRIKACPALPCLVLPCPAYIFQLCPILLCTALPLPCHGSLRLVKIWPFSIRDK